MSEYDAQIILDSESTTGKRITTFQITYPMIVHNELMTHRVFSRGSASLRAIPVKKMLTAIYENPFIPDKWYKNAKGMQPGKEITDPAAIDQCIASWLAARDHAAASTQYLSSIQDVAKEIANRLLMPFMWNTAIVTSTHYCNFFNVRCHPMAQRQIRIIAEMMRDKFFNSVPTIVRIGGLHTPYIRLDDIKEIMSTENMTHIEKRGRIEAISTGRCARVSYLNQDGVRSLIDDVTLYNRLIGGTPKHGGALEHCATALENPYQMSGNFQGWHQHRKTVGDENMTSYTHNGITVTDAPDTGE